MKKYTTVKAFVKEALKKNGYTLIAPSFFGGDESERTYIFNVFDNYGTCYTIFCDIERRYASLQSLSSVCVHSSHDVSYIFFEERGI